MKKSYIGFVAILFLFGVYVVRNFTHHKDPRGKRLHKIEKKLPNKSGLDYLVLNGEAKKVPSFLFTNQNNIAITNVDYKDKVYVMEFFFTTCPSICPIMNRNMLLVEKKYGTREDFGIASITINPETDTPLKLKEYADNYGVTSLNWHFLTGKSEDIFELSNKGMNIFAGINPEVAGGFEHQGYFALIDRNGYIRSRKDNHGNSKVFYQGTDTNEVSMLIEDIQLLLEE